MGSKLENIERHSHCPMRRTNKISALTWACEPLCCNCVDVDHKVCSALHQAYATGETKSVNDIKEQLSHIQLMTFTRKWSDTVKEECAALFDDRQISADSVKKFVQVCDMDYDCRVAIMPEAAFNNVFASLREAMSERK